MIGLIKDTATLKMYVRVAASFKFDSFKPYIVDAQKKYIAQYLGDVLLEGLDTWYNAGQNPAYANYKNLLPYVQAALTKFTLALGAPSFDTLLTEGGFAVTSNQNLAPASDRRVKAFIDSMMELGWNEVETMLRFLETNKANYSSWVSSTAYTEYHSNFIINASDFDKIIRIDQSRLRFMALKPAMDNVEMLKIEPVISKAMGDDIKAKVKAGTMTAAYNALLPKIQRAVANYTMFEDTQLKKYEEMGTAFLSEVKLVIDGTPTSYPIYAASDCYVADKTSYNNYENTEDSSIFSMGGH